jgi:hypothetical protein
MNNLFDRIKAGDLRIGNYIIRDGIDYDAGGDKFRDREGDEIVVVADISAHTINQGSIPLDHCSGIELSPEILEACGFENTHPKSWYLSWESYELQYSLDDKELGILSPNGCTTGHTVYFPCGYLHLLQNIYFFFTGTELPIDEKIFRRAEEKMA